MRAAAFAAVLALLLPAVAGADCGDAAVSPAALREKPPPEGDAVAVHGVVAANFGGDNALGGLYVQATGSEPAGVFVYAPDRTAAELPPAGTRVRVSARSGRYHGRFQLEWVQRIERCGRATLAPVALELPATAGRLTMLEDTLVRLDSPLVVTGNHDLGRYGSLRLAVGRRLHSSGGKRGQPAGVLLDDGRYTRDPRPVPYLDGNGTRRAGDRVYAVTGILDRAFGAWRIHPVEPPRFAAGNPRARAPGRRGAWRVASLNLENYFITRGGRGAPTAASFRAQQRRLVAALTALDADVLALQEIENRPAAVRRLVAALNRSLPGARHYRSAAAGRDRGGAVLRNALLYRPSRFSVERVVLDQDRTHNRAPVAARLRDARGRRAWVVSVHFKSRGGCPAEGDADRGAGCWARRRTRQARALSVWLHGLAGGDRALVLGDFNTYPGEPPLRVLAGGRRLQALAVRHIPPGQRYSYVYRGRAGLLDHALATPGLAESVRGVRLWHINADEPPVAAGRGPWRSSDHDPLLVDLFPPR
ncbi:ExeM/NucH family extracellular endonuclease [Arhodomonas aquaeolei]|uniref:ExeM/NucH family extracellular endonuclease n=1 Tax=Arhodomonas aquaeolei TaxID=2369 RepID=UPI002167E5E0|nr:ExeM/NucH family extracellular endonuclease [Arhodomonas aquaeolei]MCS4503192.1 ExeM/NucH family extracellular endonuclease [Arhodomonas aquaeolei]